MSHSIEKLNLLIIKNRDDIDTYAGVVGLMIVSICFCWFRPLYSLVYLLFFLVGGYLFRMLDEFIDKNKAYVSTWKIVGCGFDVLTLKIMLSATSNFLLLGVYGIIVAIIFQKLWV